MRTIITKLGLFVPVVGLLGGSFWYGARSDHGPADLSASTAEIAHPAEPTELNAVAPLAAELEKEAEDAPDKAPLFRDWPRPEFVVLFSGQQHGYLEPCGCSPEFQKGGLARRFGFIKAIQQRRWPTVQVDLGGLLDDHSQPPVPGKFIAGQEQAQAKLEIALEALHQMRYDALNLGPEDISVPQGFVGLMGLLINLDNPPLPRVVSANLDVSKDFLEAGLVFPQITREVAGVKVAFVGMVGEKYKDRMSDPDLKQWIAPDKFLGEAMAKLSRETGYQILLLYGPQDEAKAIAQRFPSLDVIIHGSEAEEPSGREEWVGKTMLVTIGSKGKYAGAIGVFKGEPRLRFELVALDDRFEQDKGIRELLDNTYIEKLASLNLVENSPKVAYHKDQPNTGFVGSKKCGECHEKVYEFYQTTRHAHALETLVKGYENKGKTIAPGKQANPECVSCHVTGFVYTTGYDGTERTSHLGGNGCENCHGAGSEHVRLMSNLEISSDEKRLAKKMVHAEPQDDKRNVCTKCHDAENSPKFDLTRYWEQIDHGAEAAEDQENWPKIRLKFRKN